MFAQSALKLLFINIAVLVLVGCGSKKEEEPKTVDSHFEDYGEISNENVTSIASDLLGEDVFYAEFDYFGNAQDKSIACISTEKKFKTTYGIKFTIIEFVNGEPNIKYSTDFLDGIKEGTKYGSINFVNKPDKFLYYNSRSTFIGSAGAELFIYVFNTSTGELFTFYYSSEEKEIRIEYSENLKIKENEFLKRWINEEAQSIIPEIKQQKAEEQFVDK